MSTKSTWIAAAHIQAMELEGSTMRIVYGVGVVTMSPITPAEYAQLAEAVESGLPIRVNHPDTSKEPK